MGRLPTGMIERLYGRQMRKARDDGTVARHFLRTGSGKTRRRMPLGDCDFREAQRRAAMMLGLGSGRSADESQWLRSVVAAGEAARAMLETGEKPEAEAGQRIEGAWERWTAAGTMSTRPATLRAVEARWKRFVRWAKSEGVCRLEDVTPQAARRYAGEVASRKASAARDLQTLRAMWRDLGAGTAWDGVKVPKRHEDRDVARRYRRMETAEVRAILRECDEEERRVVLAAFCCALRLSDAASLRTTHFREGFGVLDFAPSKTRGSKSAPLAIPVHPMLREELAALDGAGSIAPGLAAMRGDSLARRFVRVFRRAGVSDSSAGKASFHSLRATFISLMDEAGVPPHVTDSMTGHAKQGMHGRYSQPGMEAKRAAVEKAIPMVRRDAVRDASVDPLP